MAGGKIITWVDLQGRYRVTSPAYADLLHLKGFDEQEALDWTWTKIVAVGNYGIDSAHPHFIVEDADQRARLEECCGTYFRYGVFMLPNRERLLDREGRVILKRDARDGAWEMDVDGRPKVNMTKAKEVQRDYFRVARAVELEKESGSKFRQPPELEALFTPTRKARLQALRDIPQNFDLAPYRTPQQLKEAWPVELLPRTA